jgi:hypothetical protein
MYTSWTNFATHTRSVADNCYRPSHMTRLFEVCKAPKLWKELPNGSHNDTVAEPRYFQYFEEFLSEFVAR